jgi:nitroreductase
MENEVLKAIRERRSYRKYKTEQIKDEELQAVLEAGTWAPNGMGRQDSFIVAVQKKEVIDKLVKMNADVMGVTSNPYYGAPTIVLVFGSADWANNVKDGSLVLGTMMLAAHSVGLASCWINREDAMFATDEGKQMMKEMGLPDGLVGIGALSLGYAAVEAPAPKPRKEGYYRIVR